MAKITLRSYTREIEVITDQGKIDFAIAHCLHILKYFPKHVDTYRLLGKAYLENQRLGDAADIFQRVLSAVPDDFVSHIGMSIIREDEGNLDAAIWHMQRAYDVQSSNITIQDELRRLYDRRDGIEPPKIRLTRAALARMYARGDLVTEAIAELRAALQEEPDRADLLILLARMYATNQQRVKSIQTCSQVLNKLPYCLEANLIIARALEETNRLGEAHPYLERARELDPYAAFISDQAPTIDLVPDAAVTLIKLDEGELRSYTTAAAAQPAWVTTLGAEMPETAGDEEDIEWLLEEPGTPADTGFEEEDLLDDDELAADLAASEAFGTGGAFSIDDLSDDGDTEPARLEPEDLYSAPDEEKIPDWMAGAGWEPSDSAETRPEELPDDWDAGLESQLSADPEAEEDPDDSGLYRARIPDWLQALAPSESDEAAQPGAESIEFESADDEPISFELEEEPAGGETEIPDWLAQTESGEEPAGPAAQFETGGEESGEGELPDWLTAVDAHEDEPDTQWQPETPATEETQEELPEWLTAMALETPDDRAEPAEEAEGELADAELPDWLQQMALRADASSSFTEGDPEDRTGVTLWLERNANRIAGEAEEEEGIDMELPTDEPMEEPEDSGEFTEMDDDEAMRWLESLAAKQGVDEEELLTAPEERLDAPPDWIRNLGGTPVDVPDAGETVMETPAPDDEGDWEEIEEAVGDMTELEPAAAPDAMDWLESLGDEDETEDPEFISQPEGTVEDSPGWEIDETSEIDREDLPEWLRDQIGDAPEAEAAGSVPSWLQDLGADETAAGSREAEPAGDVPDWLREMAEVEGVSSSEDDSGVPDWLQQTMMAPSPFDRAEQPPEEAGETVLEEPAEDVMPDQPEFAPAAEVGEPAVGDEDEDAGDVPAWLRDMVEAEEAEGAPGGDDIPDWLQQTMLGAVPMADEAEADEMPEIDLGGEPDEAEEPYAWEQEGIELEEAGVETVMETGQETVLEEMDEDPAVEMHAEAEEEMPREQWWDRDTGSYERPEIPASDVVDEMASETVMETPDEPAVEPIVEMIHEEPEMEPFAEAEPEMAPGAEPVALDDARGALRSGDLETALGGYQALIREKANLGEVIADLRGALEYDHPVNIDIWATLGDAYAGNDNLQDALDAYTKAEELLR